MINTINKYLELIDKKERILCYVILTLTLLTVFLETLSVGLVIPFMQVLLSEGDGFENIFFLNNLELDNFAKEDILIYAILFLAIIYTFKTVLLTFFSYIENDFLSKVKVNISKKLFTIYINKPYLFHVNTHSSVLSANLIELKRFSAIIRDTSTFLTEVLILFCILALLLYFEPFGTIICIILFSIFALIFYFKIQKNARRWGEERQLFQSFTIKSINDCFKAIKEIKLFNKENFFIDNFVKNSKIEIETEFKKHTFINSLPRFWFEWITLIGLFSLISFLYITHKDVDKILPTIVLFGAAAFRLAPSVIRIMNVTQKIRYNYPIVENLLKVIKETKFNEGTKNSKIETITDFKKIEISNLNFKYTADSKYILRNLNFIINKNNIIGITGKSGSGKTTLINILLGLIEVGGNGKIYVDGKKITNDHINFSKNMIGYVPQNIYLFDDTIKKNIAFGLKDHEIDEKKILEILDDVQLKKFVLNNKNGINSNIGEFGGKLSGGQIQRIGIARAVYFNPKILILDESTNALDTETEKKILEELINLKTKMTIIIIAHRDSVLKKCDQILNLNDL